MLGIGTILRGVTHDSIMPIWNDTGRRVREETYSVEQWRAYAGRDRLKEAVAFVLSAVFSTIGKWSSVNGDFTSSGGAAGPVAMGLRNQLVDIRYGRTNDPHNWIRKVF